MPEVLIWQKSVGNEEFLRQADSETAIFFSFMTPHLPQVSEELEILQKTSEKKKPLLIAGGPHVSGNCSLPLQMGFDFLFQNDAEESFPDFWQKLAEQSLPEKVFFGLQASRLSFEKYYPLVENFRRVPPLEIMRGCRWNCNYCQTANRKSLSRSLDSIKFFLEQLKKRRMKRISFIAPSALEAGKDIDSDNYTYLDELLSNCRSLNFKFIEYGIFPSEIRPDTVNQEYLSILKKYVTNKSLTIGAQSLLDFRLRAINRGHFVGDVEQAVSLANENGFRVNLDIIFAFPDESEEEREELIRQIRIWSKKYRVKFHLHHFLPLAGSKLEFRKPAEVSQKIELKLRKLSLDGIATDWWQEGLQRTGNYFNWLQKKYPDYYQLYN